MKAQEPTKIRITVVANSFIATIDDNATARAFVLLLPMTVTMSELNGNEKYHYLSGNMPASPENQSTIHNGDLMLYGSNCIVLFYETFNTSYSYTKIGTIDNPTDLKPALGPNNPTVKFELIGNTTGIDSKPSNNIEFHITNNGLLQYTGNANEISLLDINGRVLSSTKSGTINLNSVPRGVYILKTEAQGQNKTRTIKFMY